MQVPVFKHLLHNLITKGEAKGIRHRWDWRRTQTHLPVSPRKISLKWRLWEANPASGCSGPAAPLCWPGRLTCIICISYSELSSREEQVSKKINSSYNLSAVITFRRWTRSINSRAVVKVFFHLTWNSEWTLTFSYERLWCSLIVI